jgi:hypothetical protein
MRTTFLLGTTLLAIACKSDSPVPTVEFHSLEPAKSADDPPPEESEPIVEHGAGTRTVDRTHGMALEEGKMGKKDSDRGERAAAIESARTAGVLGSGSSASITGTGDLSSGFDDASIYGGLTAESSGGFGYGRSGLGPGGGGSGRSGTIGKGSGTGSGYGVGGGRGVRAAASAPAIDGVKAGEWDDNANYRDYLKWIKEAPRSVVKLDTSDRQFVVIRDKDGKPVPNCPVTIRGTKGGTTLLTSTAGRVLVFPKAFGLGEQLTATTTCAGTQVAVSLGTQLDAITEMSLTTARSLPAQRSVDLAFVLDTTGSMSEEIDAVKSTITAVADQLASDQTSVRIGLVEYKDRSDDTLTRVFPFSSNLAAFSRRISDLSAAGGGDQPEDMHAGVHAALDKLRWRSEAVTRIVIVIADAPPHLDYQGPHYGDAALRAARSGIKLYTVSASGMDTTGQIVMRQMAQLTGGTNLFVLRGGAGPQSTGGGDPKSSCGGTQEQYATGNLHALVISKVKRELAALDGDPLKIPGVGKDESAKPCNQRVAQK